MDNCLLYPVGVSENCHYASLFLEQSVFSLTDHLSPDITHLLLDVPSFEPGGMLRDGSDLKELLRRLPKSITIIGGNLAVDYLNTYPVIDLLKDPFYLAKNAAVTAECALQVAAAHMKTTFADTPALILGWGRIGKCLARLLLELGCNVTVAARKECDRAMLAALGYEAVDFSQIPITLRRCRMLFNTVPNLPLHSSILDGWNNGIAIDLASYPGMAGSSVIPARGLPGKYAPETSGKLIAQTVIRRMEEEKR